MPSELNRRTLFAAAAAFLAALAVAYGLSSPGEASQGSGPPGSPAEPLDVASGVEGQSTLGEADALPGLVLRPNPKPKQAPSAENVEAPAPSAPAAPAPTYVPPAPVAPSAPAPPPIEFSDSG
jgi:hypothetical protein